MLLNSRGWLLIQHRQKLLSIIHSASKGRTTISTAQRASIKEQRTVLRDKLTAWLQLRSVYIPGLLQLLSDINKSAPAQPDEEPETFELWLPSALPETRRRAACYEGLPSIESRLRTAQCYDSLDDVRYVMRVKARMVQFKNQNVRGQREGIRSRAVVDRVHEKAMTAVRRYRRSRQAKLTLDGPGEWEKSLRDLRDEDVRSYRDPERMKSGMGRVGTNEDTVDGVAVIQSRADPLPIPEENILRDDHRNAHSGTGETYKMLSWIWTTAQNLKIDDHSDSDDQVLRAEWCRSRARAKRTEEEVQKVQEEMARTLRYLEWKSEWWIEKVQERGSVSEDLKEGLRAYALEQSGLQLSLRVTFKKLWARPLSDPVPPPESSQLSDDEGDDVDSDEETEDNGEARYEGNPIAADIEDEDNDNDDDDDDDEESGLR